MPETKQNKLQVSIDPRLLTKVEQYAEEVATDLEYAVADLLREGLARLKPQTGGGSSNGKRMADQRMAEKYAVPPPSMKGDGR